VFDLAGMSGAVATNRAPIKSLDNDCRSQLEFLNACALAGNRPHVVFSSSRLVYGETGHQPVAEDHPVSPRSIYAAHRICVENYLQIYARLGHITYSVCRISNVYGCGGARHTTSHGILNNFIRTAVEGKPITLFGDGSQLRDYIYIADLVESLIRCGIRPAARNQVFNVGSGASVTMREAASMICDLTGAPPLHFAPWPSEWGTVESGDYVANTQKARSILGLSCDYGLEAGIAETVELYRRPRFVPAESGVEMERAARSAQA
jgi:UDP-glucose 4-epimerase